MGKRFANLMLFCLVAVSLPARGQVYPDGFADVQVADGINTPTALAFTPDGRIFVCEQSGKVRVIKSETLLPTPFLQLNVNATGERGLIGLTVDPDFEDNRFVYVYYTVPSSPIHNRISRFTADGDVSVPGSETILLELDNLSTATNHNGGAMHFGADGKLYVAIGENATPANAQNLDTYHGKFLRIDKDGGIPTDNPFSEGSVQKKRIWSYGLRNPFTFSIHPKTGRIYINDVGQNTWEEINDATAGGQNFGWPIEEGFGSSSSYSDPVYAYSHGAGDGKGCAITGGAFYEPVLTPYPGEYYGKYFFQDYCNGWINYIDLTSTPIVAPFATGLGSYCLGLTVGNDGNLYYLSRTKKALYKIIYSKATTPFITSQPADLEVTEGQPGFLEVKAMGTSPLHYQWYKDGEIMEEKTGPSLLIPDVQPKDAGVYKVIVSNDTGDDESDEATLTVINVNDVPAAAITSPAKMEMYTAGSTLFFSGTALDEEDGLLPAAAYSWSIVFHHDEHVHDQPALEGISSGGFEIPDEGETSDNVWYEIILTVTDSDGLTGTDTVNVFPRKSLIHLTTDPEGLQLLLDDQPFVTPGTVASVEGMKRRIGVISPQAVNETTFAFDGWAHGGSESQVIVTPVDDTTFTALFSIVLGVDMAIQERAITVFPNPLLDGDQVEVYMPSEMPLPVRIYLVDPLSRQVEKFETELKAGANAIPVDIAFLSNGVYGLIVESGEKKTMIKLLINR